MTLLKNLKAIAMACLIGCVTCFMLCAQEPDAHWSFQSLERPDSVPNHLATIDSFVQTKLSLERLQIQHEADPRTLLRRLYFDMIGLPPSYEDIQAFTQSTDREEAYHRAVDFVLSSPRYGERWAQHWLDLVRYADTHGYEVNTERPNAWPYRDYVIGAFNEDKPYDQFIFEQLAGDTVGQDTATGFLVAAPALLPGQIGKDDASKRLARQDALDEIIVSTGETFLGISIGCARCHDHKFDPISAEDYYAFQAFFAGVEYGDRPINDARAEQKGLTSKKESLRQAPMIYGGIFREPDTTFVLNRGDPEQRREKIHASMASSLGEIKIDKKAKDTERRVALAQWISRPDNPLTARVMVNRIWQFHFGRGLVDTPSDFGYNGASPTHPQLLDWLATEFIDSGWSMKHIHRLILRSRTFRQSALVHEIGLAKDSDARLLWRFPGRRLEGEAIRDSILQTSGMLNLDMGGPGFNFFKKRGGLDGYPPVMQFGAPGMRRMIYGHKVRMERVPVFGAFDCPDAGQPMPRRNQSTTAIQALNLFNSSFVLTQSNQLADRIRSHYSPNATSEEHAIKAFQWTLGRHPSQSELAGALVLVENEDLTALCRVLFNCSEFIFIP